MKKLLLKALTVVICIITALSGVVYASPLDEMKAKHLILVDYDSGKVLYERNIDEKMYPASTTKIWTCYLVLKHNEDLNKKITIKDLPAIDGSSMYLENGETFTLKELLDCLMVRSANDVAYALAQYMGNGDPQKFYDMMNEEAKAVGATHTHFNNPHGLPDPNHYTTARDMMIMSRVAMHDSRFRNIVKLKGCSYKPTDKYKYNRHFDNSNKFLTSKETMKYDGKDIPFYWDKVDGVKTGYTDDAGNCLVSSAVIDGHRLMAGVFKAPAGNLYHDSRALLEYGFNTYDFVKLVNSDENIKRKKMPLSKQRELFYKPASDFSIITLKGKNANQKDYSITQKLTDTKLPIKKGDKVGIEEIKQGDKKIATIDLVASNDVSSIFSDLSLDYIKDNYKRFIPELAILLICLLILLLLIVKLFKFLFGSNKKTKAKKNKAKAKRKNRQSKQKRRRQRR